MIDNLDYEIEATNITIRTMMSRLNELEDKREAEVRRIAREASGYISPPSTCYCWWVKGKKKPEMRINPKCKIHGEGLKTNQH